ncbi:hypothetical protein BHE74_00036208 [Ensete ventricosum]|nr:hypothetical protein BHE74_00036208 [Ensete ventricosum]
MFGRENPPHRPSPFSFLPLRALSVHPCFPAAFSPRRPQPSFPPATMAPKKRASASSSSSSSSSSSRRNNQSQQPSQPSKFGIQHFFERHSQSQTAASSSFPNPPDPIPDRNLNPPQPEPAAADKPPPPDAPSEGGQSSSWQISPEVSKSVTNKRVRFSPGMDPSCSNSKLEKWLSSSAAMASDKSLSFSREVLFEESEDYGSHESNDDAKIATAVDLKSSFRTPPSMPYGSKEQQLIGGVDCNEETEQLGSQVYRKILRLLNEQSGQERILHLCDEWFYTLIGPGDTISVVGDFDEMGRCIVDHAKNLVIVHPDILLSGTRVIIFFCGLLTAGLLKEFPSRQFLEEYAGMVLQKNIENIYACGAFCQEGKSMSVDFGHSDGIKEVNISENSRLEKEITIAMEHCAQVILYTLLMSDRYMNNDINSGLLYYLQMDQTQVLSTEAGRIAVASGVINDISRSHVSVKCLSFFWDI